MLKLDKFLEILESPNVNHTIRPQCPYGAEAAKMSSWVCAGFDVEDIPAMCPHPVVYWYKQGDGEAIYARRPPSRGRLRYYLSYEEAISDHNRCRQSLCQKGLNTTRSNLPTT